MVFIKAKLSMERNMEWVNIISKMVTFMKDKCSKEKCKVKENIHGLIKIFMKELLFKIK
jgi:hypothetical protein